MFGNLFSGRNGIDRYSLFIALVSLLAFPYPYIRIAGFILLGYAIFRAFSRNLDKRRMELNKFEDISRSAARYIMKFVLVLKKNFMLSGNTFTRSKARLQQRKQYIFIKCPECKKTLRLPRNRLQATCPVCKAEFIKKT